MPPSAMSSQSQPVSACKHILRVCSPAHGRCAAGMLSSGAAAPAPVLRWLLKGSRLPTPLCHRRRCSPPPSCTSYANRSMPCAA